MEYFKLNFPIIFKAVKLWNSIEVLRLFNKIKLHRVFLLNVNILIFWIVRGDYLGF